MVRCLRPESGGGRTGKSEPRLASDPAERRDLELARDLGVSLRRFQGWEPRRRVTVTERDESGRAAQWVIETEPEFDVNERDSWYALWEYEQEVCPDCGNLRSVCSDPENAWYPQRTVCWGTASKRAFERRWERKFEKAQPDADGNLPTDGVRVWASVHDLSPDDDFI